MSWTYRCRRARQVNGEISLRTRSSGSKGMEAKHPRSIRERISELGP